MQIPLRVDTAILLTLRNEDPARALKRLRDRQAEHRRDRCRRPVLLLHPQRHQRCGGGNRGRSDGARLGARNRHPASGGVSPPPPQRRIQGRQRARFLRPLGRILRADAPARRRQSDDRRYHRADGPHDAGLSAARHPPEPCHGHAVEERFCPHFPVRHASWNAPLYDGLRVVDGRLRPLLGPQRPRPHQALHRKLRPAGPAGPWAALRPRALARSGRGHPDAPGRLRGPPVAGRMRQLGRKPADPRRFLPPRRALVPGQSAIHEAAAVAGPVADESISSSPGRF